MIPPDLAARGRAMLQNCVDLLPRDGQWAQGDRARWLAMVARTVDSIVFVTGEDATLATPPVAEGASS